MSGPAPARLAAWRALVRLRAGHAKLDDSQAALPELNGLADRDRRLATELVTGTVKRRLSVDTVLSSFASMPLSRIEADVHEALRMSAFQMLFLDRIPAHAAVDDGVALVAGHGRRTRGFANAVLRGVAREGRARFAGLASGDTPEARAVRLSCPKWLLSLLDRDRGLLAAEALLASANEAPEHCLRVNTLRGDLASATVALTEAGFETEGVPGLPEALLYEGPPLESSAPFTAGLVTPQSRGSQLAGLVATGSGMTGGAALDLCAAPGMKTAQLMAAHPRTRVVAVEVDPLRAETLRANLRRLGATGVEVVRKDAADLLPSCAKAFDTVLVDAPCTGLGTMASRADVRWRRRPGDVTRLADEQRRLLAVGARCVRLGGLLTYTVCTVTRAETEGVVESLLGTGDWALDDLGAEFPGAAHPVNGAYLLALPPVWGSTGFFIARLRREPR